MYTAFAGEQRFQWFSHQHVFAGHRAAEARSAFLGEEDMVAERQVRLWAPIFIQVVFTIPHANAWQTRGVSVHSLIRAAPTATTTTCGIPVSCKWGSDVYCMHVLETLSMGEQSWRKKDRKKILKQCAFKWPLQALNFKADDVSSGLLEDV